ncbi:hypothetical protein [Thermoactinomyces mirandus]|uniref:Uncharacterized protein n=1 Tax=Thermoactinomyces mirandus TaxID=2756294 RepID=A0A7W1XS38_9BACL|nr:hypothetical protein [Thermoactinomyces mirandus]MBA4602035.1 hypothetical protein [Thermoactinomyces mirandus]
MEHHRNNELNNLSPGWLRFWSFVLSVVAFCYIWFKYSDIVNSAVSGYDYWYVWIRPALIGLVGILCLLAAILSLAGKRSATSVFMGGISVMLFILLSNLVILVIRVVHRIFAGDAWPVFERILERPHRVIVVLLVVLTLSILHSLSKKNKKGD